MNAIQQLATEIEINQEKLKIWDSARISQVESFMATRDPFTIIPFKVHKTRILPL